MRLFTTMFLAVDPQTGMIKEWAGPRIRATTWKEAEDICKERFGHCFVDSELQSEIDEETGEKTDFIFYS